MQGRDSGAKAAGSNAGRIASDAPRDSAGNDTRVPPRWKSGMTIMPTSSEFQFTDGSVAAARYQFITAPWKSAHP